MEKLSRKDFRIVEISEAIFTVQIKREFTKTSGSLWWKKELKDFYWVDINMEGLSLIKSDPNQPWDQAMFPTIDKALFFIDTLISKVEENSIYPIYHYIE